MKRIALWFEQLWQRIAAYLFWDRLAYQYELGYAQGVSDGIAHAEHFRNLTPEELEAVKSEPSHRQGWGIEDDEEETK